MSEALKCDTCNRGLDEGEDRKTWKVAKETTCQECGWVGAALEKVTMAENWLKDVGIFYSKVEIPGPSGDTPRPSRPDAYTRDPSYLIAIHPDMELRPFRGVVTNIVEVSTQYRIANTFDEIEDLIAHADRILEARALKDTYTAVRNRLIKKIDAAIDTGKSKCCTAKMIAVKIDSIVRATIPALQAQKDKKLLRTAEYCLDYADRELQKIGH